MEKNKDIYDLKPHESTTIDNGAFVVTRVPGGWIYTREEPQVNIANPVFVPYSKEFI